MTLKFSISHYLIKTKISIKLYDNFKCIKTKGICILFYYDKLSKCFEKIILTILSTLARQGHINSSNIFSMIFLYPKRTFLLGYLFVHHALVPEIRTTRPCRWAE